jgi:hypothetical protein
MKVQNLKKQKINLDFQKLSKDEICVIFTFIKKKEINSLLLVNKYFYESVDYFAKNITKELFDEPWSISKALNFKFKLKYTKENLNKIKIKSHLIQTLDFKNENSWENHLNPEIHFITKEFTNQEFINVKIKIENKEWQNPIFGKKRFLRKSKNLLNDVKVFNTETVQICEILRFLSLMHNLEELKINIETLYNEDKHWTDHFEFDIPVWKNLKILKLCIVENDGGGKNFEIFLPLCSETVETLEIVYYDTEYFYFKGEFPPELLDFKKLKHLSLRGYDNCTPASLSLNSEQISFLINHFEHLESFRIDYFGCENEDSLSFIENIKNENLTKLQLKKIDTQILKFPFTVKLKKLKEIVLENISIDHVDFLESLNENCPNLKTLIVINNGDIFDDSLFFEMFEKNYFMNLELLVLDLGDEGMEKYRQKRPYLQTKLLIQVD